MNSSWKLFISVLNYYNQISGDIFQEEHWPKMGRKEHGHWNHVQERIIRNTKAYVDFCVNIPGEIFFKWLSDCCLMPREQSIYRDKNK